MSLFSKKTYTSALHKHYKKYFGTSGTVKQWSNGPQHKLHSDFFILEVEPNQVHNMWAYLTVGMSLERNDDNLIELFVYSPRQDDSLVELLTINASFHRNYEALNIHHTVNIGQPWMSDSICDHGFISLPYLDGERLELFNHNGKTFHCYWFIPITQLERDYKIDKGCEALEQLFEDKKLDYLNPQRNCLID